MIAENAANIIIHIIFMVILITLIFFTYTTYIERASIIDQTSDIIRSLVQEIRFYVGDDTMKQISNSVKDSLGTYMLSDSIVQADKEIVEINTNLIIKALIFVSILVFVATIIVIWLWYKNKFSLLDLLTSNMISVIFIAAAEILFISVIVRNYKSIDENFVKNAISKNFSDFAQ